MKNKLKVIFLSIVLSLAGMQASLAKDSYDWIVRTRAIYVKPDVSSKVSTLGGHVTASTDQVPEVDFTRFFTPNIAAELILATTQHNIALKGSALNETSSLGSVRLLPPTLTLQYHANPTGTFRPYAGAGLNYTFFYGAKTPAATNTTITSMKYQDHLGYALQLGFDYMIDKRIGINFDVKKIFLKTNVQVNNAYTAQVRLDPWLIGAGISYRF